MNFLFMQQYGAKLISDQCLQYIFWTDTYTDRMNIYTTVASLVSPEQSRARCKRQHILRQSLFKGFTDRIKQFISDTGIRLASKLIRISRYLPARLLQMLGCVVKWKGTESKLECWNIRYYFLSIYNQGGVRVTWKET